MLAPFSSLFVLWSLLTLSSNAFEVVSPDSISGVYTHVQASYGPSLSESETTEQSKTYKMVAAQLDFGGCQTLDSQKLSGKVVLVRRGPVFLNGSEVDKDERCRFLTKTENVQNAGGIAAVIGNEKGESWYIPQMYADSKSAENVTIPSIAVSLQTIETLLKAIEESSANEIEVRMNKMGQVESMNNNPFETFVDMFVSIMMLFVILVLCTSLAISGRRLLISVRRYWDRRHRRERVDTIPTIEFEPSHSMEMESLSDENSDEGDADDSSGNDDVVMEISPTAVLMTPFSNSKEDSMKRPLIAKDSEDSSEQSAVLLSSAASSAATEKKNRGPKLTHNDTCAVCLESFKRKEKIKMLPCRHGFHQACIREWIIKKGKCPVCIREVFPYSSNNYNA